MKPEFNTLPYDVRERILDDMNIDWYEPYEDSREECISRMLWGHPYSDDERHLDEAYERITDDELKIIVNGVVNNLRGRLEEVSALAEQLEI